MITSFNNYIIENLIPNKDYFPSKTSIKQVSLGLKYMVETGYCKKGDTNLDYGGGRFELGTEYMKEHGITNLVYDVYSRDSKHNIKVIEKIIDNEPDTVTLLNVLNVIHSKTERLYVIEDAYSYLKVGGYMLIMVYIGTGKEPGLSKSKTWQENRDMKSYLPEIQEAIPNLNHQIIRMTSRMLLIRKTEYTKENIRTKKGSLIKRYRNVGKLMGDDLYFHKNYVSEYIDPDFYNKAKSLLPKGFDFNIIKYNEKYGTISFIDSPDFDTSDEPIVGDSYKVTTDGRITYTRRKNIPQIYHHKWLFVKDDYSGFDVEESKERSRKWLEYSDRINMSKIGYKNYWEDEVLPLLKQNESINDYLKPKSKQEIINSVKYLSSYEKLIVGCKNDILWLVKQSLDEGADISQQEYKCLIILCIYNRYEIFKYLLDNVEFDPSFNDNSLLEISFTYSSDNIIELLLKDKRVIDKLSDEDKNDFKKYIKNKIQ